MWVKLHRKMLEHWISEDSEKLKRWLIMLCEVNFKEGKFLIGNKVHIIPVGSCAYSVRKWSTLFNCSTKSTLNFFKLLENEKMITRKTIGKGKHSTTLINITNYDTYQGCQETLTTTQGQHKSDTIEERKEERKNIPLWEEFQEYALSKQQNLDPSHLRLKYDAWLENDWSVIRNNKQQPIKNWKSTLLQTIPYIKTVSPKDELRPLTKGEAVSALNVPAMLDKLLKDGYTKEQINNYAK